MISTIRDFTLSLTEELKYHDTVLEHKKNLETTLWGLEEQALFPENTSNLDQTEIVDGINRCQLKILSCSKLITAHEKKLVTFIYNFKEQVSKSSCSPTCG